MHILPYLDTYFSCGVDMIRGGGTCSPFAPCGRYLALVAIRAPTDATTNSLHLDPYRHSIHFTGTTLFVTPNIFCTLKTPQLIYYTGCFCQFFLGCGYSVNYPYTVTNDSKWPSTMLVSINKIIWLCIINQVFELRTISIWKFSYQYVIDTGEKWLSFKNFR